MNFPTIWHFTYIFGVKWFTQHVEDMAEDVIAYRNRNTSACISNGRPTGKPIRCLHTNHTDFAVTNLLGDLSTDSYFLTFQFSVHLNKSVDLWQRTKGKFNIYYWASNSENLSVFGFGVVFGHSHI